METAAALALALALAGCGSNNPRPAPAPTKSASTSPSPSGEVAPTMPPEAKGTDEAAAKAFARHVVAQLNYSQVTGDTSGLRLLFDRACAGCAGIVEGLDRVYADGGSVKTKGWSISGLQVTRQQRGVLVVATVDVAPQIVTAKRGEKPKRFPGAIDTQRRLFLERGKNAWIVTNLDEG